MPKDTEKKNSKGKKKSSTTKVVKESTKRVVKEPFTIEEKPIVKEEKNRKIERKNSTLDSLLNNTPFVVALCVIVILGSVTILLAVNKRVPRLNNGDEVVASVNGRKFTTNDLYDALKENLGTDALVDLIDTYIAGKEVTEFSEEDEAHVDEVVNYYKSYATSNNVDFDEFLTNYLALPGVTNEKEFHDYVLEDYRKVVAVRNFIADEASEDDIKKYYDDNYSDKITFRHILIEVKDGETSDKDALKAAKDLIKKLNKVTDSKKLESEFSELAKDNSDDPGTYSNGGLLENQTKTQLDENFWKALSELKDGEYTKEPVKSAYGYHVILRLSSTPVEKYDDIKDQVKVAYAEDKLNNDEDSTLQVSKWDELRKKYKFTINDDFIKNKYEEVIKNALSTKE